MGIIKVTGIRCFAYHGCMQEEALIGGEFEVNVILHTDLSASAATDELKDTIDYVDVNRIVVEEMNIRSKLIEHVGGRILHRFKQEFPSLISAEVEIIKINPPINGDVTSVSVVMSSN
jgi:7,8-dihydroneopterin aldolase/epimerase/oxygenase